MSHARLVATLAAVAAMLAAATPVLAHGDHDARPLARALPAGPYSISLWQVYADAGSEMTPHLIVLFDGASVAPARATVRVEVNAAPVVVMPSMTTANGFETMGGLVEGDVVTVSIASDDGEAWRLAPVVVPPPPTSMLPMRELLYAAIFLTAIATIWFARRTASVWRGPVVRPG